MSTEELQKRTTVNIQEKANLIWAIADKLVGTYKPHEYGNVVLPMCVIKRFSDVLAPTKQKVLDTNAELDKRGLAVKAGFLTKASGFDFYNLSSFTLEGLLSDADNIADNFRSYLNHFSNNVIDILEKFDFDKEITKLDNNGILYNVIQEFCSKKAYMGLDAISAVDMGYIFEELVRKFSESYDEQAGAHFTARDIIYLMAELLVAPKKSSFKDEGITSTMYDMAMGTSQMLDCLSEKLLEIDPAANLTVFGQELNEQTFAIAKANMLIKGGDAENMKHGNTLSNDKFDGFTFDYIISNPPFGIEWKNEKSAVTKEHKLGSAGRFGAGLPGIGDSQQLFMLNGIAKLKENGRMAIIQDGSPFFKGDAESGESNIRKYIIENDWLEAIVRLPINLFYNTPLQTFIWVVTKEKSLHNKNKVLLIDAEKCYKKRVTPIGKKRFDLDDECVDLIMKAYNSFTTGTFKSSNLIVEAKIKDNEDFKYRKVVVEQPLLDTEGKPLLKKGKKQPDAEKRDYEYIPWKEDVDVYMDKNVFPYIQDAWVDDAKTKIGYEIPFTKEFYKYSLPKPSEFLQSKLLSLNIDGVFENECVVEDFNPLIIDNAKWETARLGKWFRERRTKVSDKDFEPLSVTKNGIVPQLENVVKTAANDDRKLVKRGDFVINSRSDRKGASGFSIYDGSVSLINIVLEPVNVSTVYMQCLLKSFVFIEEFYKLGHGIASDVWTSRFSEMKNIVISLPPQKNQIEIAAFLERFNAKIDFLISMENSICEKTKSFLFHSEFDNSHSNIYQEFLQKTIEQVSIAEEDLFEDMGKSPLRSISTTDLNKVLEILTNRVALLKRYKDAITIELLTGKKEI